MTAFQADAFQNNAFQIVLVPGLLGYRLWRYPAMPAVRRSR